MPCWDCSDAPGRPFWASKTTRNCANPERWAGAVASQSMSRRRASCNSPVGHPPMGQADGVHQIVSIDQERHGNGSRVCEFTSLYTNDVSPALTRIRGPVLTLSTRLSCQTLMLSARLSCPALTLSARGRPIRSLASISTRRCGSGRRNKSPSQ